MEIKRDYDVYSLSCECWGGAEDTLQTIMDNDLEDEFMDLFTEVFGDDIPSMVEVNDWLRFEDDWIFEQLGLNDCGGEYEITQIEYCIEDEDLDIDRDDYDTEEEYLKVLDDEREKIESTLPNRLVVTIDGCDEEELEEVLSECISDETGWLVNDFSYEKL